MNIYEKLLTIQTQVKVQKERENEFANFKYRSAEDILGEVKPLLKEQNLLLYLQDELTTMENNIYIKASAILINCEKPDETLTVIAYAKECPEPKPKMDSSQTTGCCSSYARKYALNGLFCLDDSTQDPDSMNNEKKNKPKKQEIKQQEELITFQQKNELKEKIGATQFAKEMNACGGQLSIDKFNELMEV